MDYDERIQTYSMRFVVSIPNSSSNNWLCKVFTNFTKNPKDQFFVSLVARQVVFDSTWELTEMLWDWSFARVGPLDNFVFPQERWLVSKNNNITHEQNMVSSPCALMQEQNMSRQTKHDAAYDRHMIRNWSNKICFRPFNGKHRTLHCCVMD